MGNAVLSTPADEEGSTIEAHTHPSPSGAKREPALSGQSAHPIAYRHLRVFCPPPGPPLGAGTAIRTKSIFDEPPIPP
jgi:hypothetical protein